MRAPTRNLVLAALATSALALACRDREDIKINANNATLARRDSTRPLGSGDLRIATTDSVLEVALIGDSLVTGLGSSARDKIRRATDTGAVGGSGLGANIEKMVKSTVAGALDHELHMPLSEISDIRYEDGLLVFYDKNGKRSDFIERDRGKAHPSRFSEDDARDFIALFKAKTGRR